MFPFGEYKAYSIVLVNGMDKLAESETIISFVLFQHSQRANLRDFVDGHSHVMEIWFQVVVLCNLCRRLHFAWLRLGCLALLGFLL